MTKIKLGTRHLGQTINKNGWYPFPSPTSPPIFLPSEPH